MKYVDEHGVNTLPWAVSAMKLIANSGVFDQYVPAGIRDVIFGGENMPSKIMNIWKTAMPEARFTNVYGPSEITVDCSYYTVGRDFPDGESIPIGRPCTNAELLLLDEDKRPVPAGEPGEIYVRGAGVGLGYYRDPERTSEAFMQNPLNAAHRDIVYRTGDIARYNEYGELVFISRLDHQVKHMGSRIELGEIETAAAGLDGVHLACCLYDKEAGKILLFYEGVVSEREIAALMQSRLPRYMHPNTVVKLDNMPSTPNGKIDRLRVWEEYRDGL
jgi:non-ribosomal peptide synthetase component F